MVLCPWWKVPHTGGRKSLTEFEGPLEIPGLPTLQWREIKNSVIGADWYNAIGGKVGDADGVIVNTFYELEAPQIDAIRQRWRDGPRRKTQHLFPVGPLSNAATFQDRMFAVDLDNRGATFLEWLDKQPPQSVIYMSLGTLVHFDSLRIKALALAVEDCEQRFLWVIHRGEEAALPPGFCRTNERKRIDCHGMDTTATTSRTLFYRRLCNALRLEFSYGKHQLGGTNGSLAPDTYRPLNGRHLVDVLKIAVEINPSFTAEVAEEASGTSARKVIHGEIMREMRLLLSEEGQELRS